MSHRNWFRTNDIQPVRQIIGDGPMMHANSVHAVRQIIRKYRYPDWFADENRVKEFLGDRFYAAEQFDAWTCACKVCQNPGVYYSPLGCNCRPCRHRVMYMRWWTVIQLWFIHNRGDREIEEKHGWKSGTVGSIVQKIRRAVAGQPLDGSKRTGRPRGRPRKPPIIPDNSRTSL
jgi:hypothetical protein